MTINHLSDLSPSDSPNKKREADLKTNSSSSNDYTPEELELLRQMAERKARSISPDHTDI